MKMKEKKNVKINWKITHHSNPFLFYLINSLKPPNKEIKLIEAFIQLPTHLHNPNRGRRL